MRKTKTYTKEGQTYREPHLSLARKHGSLSVCTSQCTGVLLPTTFFSSSVPLPLIAALSLGMGNSSSLLFKAPKGAQDRTSTSAETQTVSIRTDSGLASLASSSLLSNFSTGTSPGVRDTSHSPAQTVCMAYSAWDELTFSTTTAICSVLTYKIIFV